MRKVQQYVAGQFLRALPLLFFLLVPAAIAAGSRLCRRARLSGRAAGSSAASGRCASCTSTAAGACSLGHLLVAAGGCAGCRDGCSCLFVRSFLGLVFQLPLICAVQVELAWCRAVAKKLSWTAGLRKTALQSHQSAATACAAQHDKHSMHSTHLQPRPATARSAPAPRASESRSCRRPKCPASIKGQPGCAWTFRRAHMRNCKFEQLCAHQGSAGSWQ